MVCAFLAGCFVDATVKVRMVFVRQCAHSGSELISQGACQSYEGCARAFTSCCFVRVRGWGVVDVGSIA